MVSHLEIRPPKKHTTPKNIGEILKGTQRKLWKEALFAQNDKNKNISLISDTIPIKYLHEVKKSLCSFISPGIKEGVYSDEW